MVLLHACGLEQPISYGKSFTFCGPTDNRDATIRIIQFLQVTIFVIYWLINYIIIMCDCFALEFQPNRVYLLGG